VTRTVPAPAEPHVTVMLFVPWPAVMVPPFTVQLKLLPVAPVVYTAPDSLAQAVAGPPIAGAGLALIVTLYWGVVTAHVVALIISSNSTVPAPAAPHVTVMLLVPAPEVIAPPTTVQLYVLPAAAAVLYTNPVWFAHTLLLPLMTGVGFALIVTL